MIIVYFINGFYQPQCIRHYAFERDIPISGKIVKPFMQNYEYVCTDVVVDRYTSIVCIYLVPHNEIAEIVFRQQYGDRKGDNEIPQSIWSFVRHERVQFDNKDKYRPFGYKN